MEIELTTQCDIYNPCNFIMKKKKNRRSEEQ